MSDGILLINLGTPEAPTPAALRRYLGEFLGDERVVDLPRWLWWPILHGIILNTRPRRSAAKYARIWMPEGSPLLVHSERQAKLLRGLLGERGRKDVRVVHAMRYGQPAIARRLDELVAAGCRRIVTLPMYPQYAVSTSESVYDALARWQQSEAARGIELIPLREFPTHAGYIAALAASVREHWQKEGRAERLLMSFHGIPQKAVDRGDPYAEQCRATARALAEALSLKEGAWQFSFQSRFGPAAWLQPYTEPTLIELAHRGVRRVDVLCPGFVADCLETLEEIALECRDAFLAAGGREFRYIPCLNERPDWIAVLAELTLAALDERVATVDR